MEELKRFENDLRNSEETRKRFEEVLRRIGGEGRVKSDGEAFAAAAKELGYDIPIAALEQARAENEELDTAALEEMNGGEGG